MVNETNITPGKGHDEEAAKSAVPQNVRDELLDQSIESLGRDTQLTPQLEDAIGMVKRWDARRAAAKEVIRKGRFKNDEEGYRRFLEYLAPYDAATRNNLIKYEEAQTRQAIKVQNAANRKKLEDGSKSVTITANNASIAEFAEKRHTAQTEYESEINTLEKQWDEFKAFQRTVEGDVSVVAEMTKDDPELAERHKRMLDSLGEKAVEYTNKRAEIQKKKDDALAAAKASYDEQMAANRNTLRKWYEDSVNRETQFQMKCGYKPDTAFTIAVSEIGKDSQSMLCDLIDAGQGDFVQTFLDELKKDDAGLKKVVRKDDNGNPVKSPNGGELFDWEWNPHGRLCMSLKQVNQVQDYLNQKIESDIRTRNLANQQAERQFEVEASRLQMVADELSMKPELDLDAMKQLMGGAKKLQEAGYDKAYQVSSHLASIVKSAERKSSRLEKEAAKLETEADFKNELKKYKRHEKDAAALAVYDPESDEARIAVSKMVDGQNRMIILINNGISRGILKAGDWKGELEKLHAKRGFEDKRAAMNVLKDIGVSVDQEMTGDLRDELSRSGAVLQEIAPSKDIEGYDANGLYDRRIKVRNANTLIYTWTDSVTGNKYAMSGDDYNNLTEVVAAWQKRHVNPSPTGVAVPSELKDFVLTVLRNSRTQKTIKSIWGFISSEGYALGDISRQGMNAMEAYFNPTTVDANGQKVYDTRTRYDRDMEALEEATNDTAMPSLESLRRIVEEQTGVR